MKFSTSNQKLTTQKTKPVNKPIATEITEAISILLHQKLPETILFYSIENASELCMLIAA